MANNILVIIIINYLITSCAIWNMPYILWFKISVVHFIQTAQTVIAYSNGKYGLLVLFVFIKKYKQ